MGLKGLIVYYVAGRRGGGLEGRYNFQNHLKEGIHFYSQYLVGTFVTEHRKTYFNDFP